MKRAKIVQNNLGKVIRYLNIIIYFGQIYSFAIMFIDFFQIKFIWIFICDIFIKSNIFRYSKVQYYGNEYIRIFIRPKIYIRPTPMWSVRNFLKNSGVFETSSRKGDCERLPVVQWNVRHFITQLGSGLRGHRTPVLGSVVQCSTVHFSSEM